MTSSGSTQPDRAVRRLLVPAMAARPPRIFHFDFGGFDFGGAGGAGAGGGTSFRDLFGQFFRGANAAQAAQQHEPGTDLEYQIEITFGEAMHGTVKKLSFTRLDVCNVCHGTGAAPGDEKVCPTCGGSGQVTQMSGKMRFQITCSRCGGTGKLHTMCRNCGGEGRVPKVETLDVRIPPGAQRARACASRGAVMPACTADLRAILYIIMQVQPHPFFERRGDDLYTVVPVTVPEASLGAKVEVPTIDGRAQVRIPPGTNSGTRLRLREKGAPSSAPSGKTRRPDRGSASGRAEAGRRARAQSVEGTWQTRWPGSAPRFCPRDVEKARQFGLLTDSAMRLTLTTAGIWAIVAGYRQA